MTGIYLRHFYLGERSQLRSRSLSRTGQLVKALFKCRLKESRGNDNWTGGEERRMWERIGTLTREEGGREGRRGKFTVGHARGVKSAAKNLYSCLCPSMVKWTALPLFTHRVGTGNARKRNERSKKREGGEIARSAPRICDISSSFSRMKQSAFPFNGGHAGLAPGCYLGISIRYSDSLNLAFRSRIR